MKSGKTRTHEDQLTLFVVDSHVKTSLFWEKGKGLLESGVDYGSSLNELLASLSRDGSLSRMSPVFYPARTDTILPESFSGWSNSGMAFAGGFLTLNISESPNPAGECSLLQVLETEIPPKFYFKKRVISSIRQWLLRVRYSPRLFMDTGQIITGRDILSFMTKLDLEH